MCDRRVTLEKIRHRHPVGREIDDGGKCCETGKVAPVKNVYVWALEGEVEGRKTRKQSQRSV